MLQASLVQVIVESDRAEAAIMASVPATGSSAQKPDQILPMLAPHRLIGEIRLWQGHAPLPSANGILLQNFAEQGALAIERVQTDTGLTTSLVPVSGNGTHN